MSTHDESRSHGEYVEGYEDGYAARYEKNRSSDYKKGWKVGRTHFLYGRNEGWKSQPLPVVQGDGKYHVQTGYKKGAYKERYTFPDKSRAYLHYFSLNTHSGYKKRLIDPDGFVLYRYIS